jgi:hypothetical protein
MGRPVRRAGCGVRGRGRSRWGCAHAGEFFAGWLTEYSLSVDNLFVFVIIMRRFSVPWEYQQKVLTIGIVLALMLRGAFIAAGAVLAHQLVWIFYLFGALLLYTAWKLVRHGEDDEGGLLRILRTRNPMSSRGRRWMDRSASRARSGGLSGPRPQRARSRRWSARRCAVPRRCGGEPRNLPSLRISVLNSPR